MDDSSNTKIVLLVVVVAIFGLLGGYLFVVNRKMYQAGIHQQLNKKARAKRSKESWSMD
jgi:uncharacterized protein YneF (UPF0154 family)